MKTAAAPIGTASQPRSRRCARACAALLGLALAAGACAPPIDRGPVPMDMPIEQRRQRAHQLADEAQKVAAQADSEEAIERAIALYQSALNYAPSFGGAWNNLGALLLERERVLEADEAFAVASDLNRLDPRPPFNRGLIRQRRGKLAEAREFYAQSIERDPTYLPALRAHIQTEVMQRLGDEDTLDRIDRALELERDEIAIRTLKLHRLRLMIELGEGDPL